METIKVDEEYCSNLESVDVKVEVQAENVLNIDGKNIKKEETYCMTDSESVRHAVAFTDSEIDDVNSKDNKPLMQDFKDDGLNREGTKFICNTCGYASKRKCYLKDHMQRHLDPSERMIYKCKLCPYTSTCERYFRLHSQVHKCKLCSYETKHRRNLIAHTLTHLIPSDIPDSNSDVSLMQKYMCKSCSYETKYKHALKRHLLTHVDASKRMMYKCEKCPFVGKFKDNLARHMLNHRNISEIVMYKCEVCNYEARHKQYIQRHMKYNHKTISVVTTYVCGVCEYDVKDENKFKEHALTHKDVPEVTVHKFKSFSYELKGRQKQNVQTVANGSSSEEIANLCKGI